MADEDFGSNEHTKPIPVGDAAETVAPGIGGDGDDVSTAAESEIWFGRTNWKHYFARFALWVIGCVVGGILVGMLTSSLGGGAAVTFWVIAALVVISGMIVVGGAVYRIWSVKYRVTTQRLFFERGIIWQVIDQTELIRVDDVQIRKNLIDRIFGLGSVRILSTDASDREVMIDGIADPESVAEAIRSRMRTMRKKSLFVENL